ncbi:hypothetical protein LRR18_05200 [Mangrovimonas sp. AS39]|uniref:hypothetical protein n=1 Tax=Mangrovimonas futianensis TaxID=2895523 RepID=UPI001E350F0D|nr:hypothetical protein [Mangrovimonas futianensis]MCF1190974.1 hypothetical protein [Mangrovimonas futianensis]MCF1194670.1 hypothetical protein [Mangrovimonas futianensis]MCF1420429.1 hypothetical protein [Mangrovimonas futianensis]
MKSLTLTLLAALFCVALTKAELDPNKKLKKETQETVSKSDQFAYNFEVNRHVRRDKLPGAGE